MHNANKIMDRIQAINKDMTDLILRQTGVATENLHSPKAKAWLVIGEYGGRRSMICYGCQFQLLTLGFQIPLMNLLTFITRWFCVDKEKGCTPLRLVRISELKNSVDSTLKKVICNFFEDIKLLIKNKYRAAVLECAWEHDVRKWKVEQVSDMHSKIS